MKITVDACQRQVIQVVRTAMNPGNDVFYVHNGQRRILLVQLAVFAAMAGPFLDGSSRGGLHRLRLRSHQFSRMSPQDSHEFVRTHVTFVLGPFRFRKLPFC